MTRVTFLFVVLCGFLTAGIISSCGSESAADGCDASLPCSVSTNIN